MDSKIKILIGILVVGILLIGGWWVWNTQIENRCNSDSDCKFWNSCGCASKQNLLCLLFELFKPEVAWEYHPCRSCGCLNGKCTSWDIIFKEAQKTKNIELCYEIRDIDCKNYCLMAVENLIRTKERVTLSTDKTEYTKGETIKIILRNNLDKSIWYLNGHELCSDRNKGYKIYQFLAEKWVDVTPPADCSAVEGAGLPIFKELSPNDSVVFTWDSKIFDKVKGSTEAPPGKYKFLMFYKEDEKAEELKEVYSNEFTISAGREEVTITTDKTEYEQGDTVKIIVRNNLLESIWYREWDTECSGTSFSIGKKRDNEYSFYPLGLAECITDEVELKPKAARIYVLNLSEWNKTKFPHTNIDTGIYKWRFIYILKNGYNESKTIYSNEFVIK